MGEAGSGDVWASHTQLRLSARSTEKKGTRSQNVQFALAGKRDHPKTVRETQYFNCGLSHHHHQVSETFDVQN